MRLKKETNFVEKREGEEENRADYFLSLALVEEVLEGRTDGEDTKFEVELFFFPPWKKVEGGVVIVDVAENKGFTSEFRREQVSLSGIESV